MITEPADHRLHLIFLAIAMSSFSYRLNIAMTPSPSYRLGYKSALAFSRAEVLRVACELKKQFTLIVGSRRLLPDQRLANLVVVERERFSHVPQKKAIERNYE